MKTLVTAIVSTAAEGSERGALDAAIELGIGWGGWAPEPADDGDVTDFPEVYRAHARWTPADRAMAVRLNTRDSDGTLIVSFADQLSGRCKHAGDQCKQQRKPARHLILPARGRTRIPDAVRAALLQWIDDKHISVLHVVGPGEEHEPGIQQATQDAIVWMLEDALPVVETTVLDASGRPGSHRVEVDGVEVMREEWMPMLPATDPRYSRQHSDEEALAASLAPGEFLITREQHRQLMVDIITGKKQIECEPLAATVTDPDAFDLERLAGKMAEVGGQPSHVAIPLENVTAAQAAGLEVQWLPPPPITPEVIAERDRLAALFRNEERPLEDLDTAQLHRHTGPDSVVTLPGMPDAEAIIAAVCEHGVSKAGDVLFARYPEAACRFAASVASIDATGALTTEAREDLSASIKRAEEEIRRCGAGSTHHSHTCERPTGHVGVHVGRGCSWGDDAVAEIRIGLPGDCMGEPIVIESRPRAPSAKDIPEAEILAAIDATKTPLNCNGHATAATHRICEALPQWPPKVVLARLRSMARRGVIDCQCTCGCRGDWCRPEESPWGNHRRPTTARPTP